MKKVMKALALVLCLVFALSAFAACNGKTPETPETTTEKTEPEEPGTEAGATEAAPAVDGPILDDGVLNVGTNAAFPPFEYVGDDGKPDGFDMALIKLIGEKLGVEVAIADMEFGTLVSSVGNKIDVAIAGMTVTDERKETVDFSDSYYEAVQNVLVPADNTDIVDAESLKGKKIGVQLGTTGDFLVEDIKDAEAVQFDTAGLAVEALKQGSVDLVIIDANPAQVFAADNADSIKLIEGAAFEFEPEFYAIACPKGNTALLNAVNGALADIRASGEFDALIEKYIEK